MTKDFINTHPNTPWKHIINMRHFLVHGYYQVSKKIVWETAKLDLKSLKSQVEKYIEEFQ
ncbi:MAG: DUF86 domain-containing protein [Muribaculaceae bacterium]|nr:DUF86 domain-containing protein [Muribaculaceae bacterium]